MKKKIRPMKYSSEKISYPRNIDGKNSDPRNIHKGTMTQCIRPMRPSLLDDGTQPAILSTLDFCGQRCLV